MNRRIKKRTDMHQINNFIEYTNYMHENPEEIDLLFQELLINVTSFFRDKKAFDTLNNVISEFIVNKDNNETFRIWVPGCSTGEEVYTLAIILHEIREYLGKYFKIKIFGTDLDETVIKIARKGIYPENIKSDMSNARIKKFFRKKNDEYQVKKEIRELAIFAVHDVLKDPPFMKLDLISCRNLLIYLKSDAQNNLISLFTNALNKEGVLFLGPSESIGQATDYYQILDKKWKIFKLGKSYII